MTTPAEVLNAARRIALAARHGFLTTVADGIETRLVQHLEVAQDCQITFSTGPETRKAASIRLDPVVSYAMHDRETRAAATLYGSARLVDDLERRQELWIDELGRFFPNGPSSDDFVLVTIQPERIEVWSVEDELAPKPFGLNSVAISLCDGLWQQPTGTYPSEV